MNEQLKGKQSCFHGRNILLKEGYALSLSTEAQTEGSNNIKDFQHKRKNKKLLVTPCTILLPSINVVPQQSFRSFHKSIEDIECNHAHQRCPVVKHILQLMRYCLSTSDIIVNVDCWRKRLYFYICYIVRNRVQDKSQIIILNIVVWLELNKVLFMPSQFRWL